MSGGSAPGSREIAVIAHNIRSAHNVGAILRTSDVFAVSAVHCTGYTPYPEQEGDTRTPGLIHRLTNRIHKSALGAEQRVRCEPHPGVAALLAELRAEGYVIAGLELDDRAVDIAEYEVPDKIALLLGEETSGIPAKLRTGCDVLLEIPQFGAKDSLNVSVAAGIALYGLRCW